ncbi:ABC transporter permease [Clostridium felsineum]|uniref:ABC transporter permease n=1 Tax=Clostridium felsineum TaxID=36839 RepID=UPI00098CADE8|nr:ABC transporter permease [Clostridium felsineum]URZ01526.1 hypothetical protein CLAUR_015210 [Clostridium felsineum]
MKGFLVLLIYGFKKRLKDSFVIIYNVVYPIIIIGLLSYLTSNYFKGDRSFTSKHYYFIVLMPFFIFSNIITTAYAAKDENLSKTSYRFLIAPIDSFSIVLSKIISCSIVLWILNALLLVSGMFLLGINFENSIPKVLLIFFTENLMASAIGIYFGIRIKEFSILQGILSIPIAIFAVLGGCFFPVGSFGNIFEKVSYISPLMWINKGIISAIYDRNETILTNCILVTLLIGIIFSVAAVFSFKKEVFL